MSAEETTAATDTGRRACKAHYFVHPTSFHKDLQPRFPAFLEMQPAPQPCHALIISAPPYSIPSPMPSYLLCPSLQQGEKLPALPETKKAIRSPGRLPAHQLTNFLLPLLTYPQSPTLLVTIFQPPTRAETPLFYQRPAHPPKAQPPTGVETPYSTRDHTDWGKSR